MKKYLKLINFFKNGQSKMIKNHFGTKFEKRVLICYVITPFLNKNKSSISHSNLQEARVISDVFFEFGYNVDIVHYTYFYDIDYSQYDIIFGFGDVFENSFKCSTFKGKWIHYTTGAYAVYQSLAEIKRINEFNKKNGCYCSPKRFPEKLWMNSTSNSDFLIHLGNEWTRSTFEQFSKKDYALLDVSNYIFHNSEEIQRNVETSKTSYIWLGSAGSIHKGLDLCIDYFEKNQQYHFHIVGKLDEDFKKVYGERIASTENITEHGFLRLDSIQFKTVCESSSFIIMPSCSEGMATSVIAGMQMGLIPIISKECGIDINDYYGIEIEELSVNGVSIAIKKSQRIEVEKLDEVSNFIINYARKRHSIESYKKNLHKILYSILSDNNN